MEKQATLTLGPLLFHWASEKARDFYFRMADEAPLDTVIVGEIVCAKRLPFQQHYLPEVIERLEQAGKRIILSTLALIMDAREMESVQGITSMAENYLIEANDLAAVSLLKGKPFAVGPLVNIYNRSALDYFEAQGARHICLPPELPADSLKVLASAAKATLEVQAFGRLPLAIASRCYHARNAGRHRDNCQYACGENPDGLQVDTLDGEPFLAVNGMQTLSHTYSHLLPEIAKLRAMGIHSFRLSPHDTDMVAVSRLYRDVLDGKLEASEATEHLKRVLPDAAFANGFYHNVEGIREIAS